MTNDTTKHPENNKAGLLTSLRTVVPDRALDYQEALRVAELQANRLLAATHRFDSPPFPESLIEELPRVDVQRVPTAVGSSGMSLWSRGAWRIRINSAEPLVRQRFTLAHELKHVLDAPLEATIYARLPSPGRPGAAVEAVCDHFAASLLMPKRWVKRLWGQGQQDLATLAWQFEVSQQAMLIRLQNLGLVEPVPRCRGLQRTGHAVVWAVAARPPRRAKPYFRLNTTRPVLAAA